MVHQNELALFRHNSHHERIDILYLNQIHGKPLRQIACELRSSYTTIRNAVRAFKATGRTNKLLSLKKKQSILAHRFELRRLMI